MRLTTDHLRASLIALAMLQAGLLAQAADRDAAISQQARTLAEHLQAYDQRGGGNTIPIEQAILALRDLGAAEQLLEHLSHRRFGGTIVWALAELGDPTVLPSILEALGETSLEQRVESCFHLAALGAPARTWLVELAGTANLEPRQAERVRRARLRAGDETVLAATRQALAAKQADVVAPALLDLGESRNLAYLDLLLPYLDDERSVAGLELRSRYGSKVVTKDDRGWTTERTEYPTLERLGDVALEAVNRLHAPTTPEYIAWWYEVLTGPWFAGEDARDRLRAYAAAAVQAREAGAVSGPEALARGVATRREALQHRSITGLTFAFGEGGWTIDLTIDGTPERVQVSATGELRD
jgi:hypothetical protein